MRGMHSDGPYVVWVSLEGRDFLSRRLPMTDVQTSSKPKTYLARIVIESPQLEVITTANNPVLSRDELSGSNRDISQFEGLDDCRCDI